MQCRQREDRQHDAGMSAAVDPATARRPCNRRSLREHVFSTASIARDDRRCDCAMKFRLRC